MTNKQVTRHRLLPTAIGTSVPKIEEWIVDACGKCGHPELVDRLSYELTNRPLPNGCWGWATTNWGHDRTVRSGVLSFSATYWHLPRQSDAYRQNLVVHETCHILANLISRRDVQHEETWKRLMHHCGEPANPNVFWP